MHSTVYNPSNGQFGLPSSFGLPTNSVGLPPGFDPIPSYVGYDYIGQELASHGYIVVSISANGINDQDNTASGGMLARAQLVQQHIRIWDQINTSGGGATAPEFNAFQGEVNLQDIGLMGHSRGGEGVVNAYNYNLSLNTPYVIQAVLPLAPVDVNNDLINNVPLGVILPYVDGDVSDLEGLAFFDSTFRQGSTSPEEAFLVMGADHNFFNTVWTLVDPRDTSANVYNPNDAANHPFQPTDASHNNPFPGQGGEDWNQGGNQQQLQVRPTDYFAGYFSPLNKRLSSVQERAVGLAYLSGFFRRYLGGETAFQPMLAGDAAPPASALNADIHVTYLAGSGGRLDINRLDTASATNALGGAVVTSGANVQTRFLSRNTDVIKTDPAEHEPDAVNFQNYSILDRYEISWDQSSAYYENDLPNIDLSGSQALEFRVGVVPDTVFPLNFTPLAKNSYGQAQDFSVVLKDGEGDTASVKVSEWSSALYYPQGGFNTTTNGQGQPIIGDQIADPLPKLLLNMVRIPLNAFLSAAPVFDLTSVVSIRFAFNQTSVGDLVFSDISLNDSAGPVRVITDPTDSTKTALYVTGSPGSDNLVLKRGAASGQVDVSINSVDQGSFQPTGHIYLYAGAGDDELTLDFGSGQFIPSAGLRFDGGPGSNTLQIINRSAGTTWAITSLNAGRASGGITFMDVANLTGGAARDVFSFKPGGRVTGTIDGGGGGDFLDYSAESTPVVVNLAAGKASFTAGVANVQNVLGSAVGGDTLVGNALGNILVGHGSGNSLFAGSGRSLLIGGFGKNLVEGAADDDIVIGGTTSYDANIAALLAILSEWQGPGSFAARVAQLRAGVVDANGHRDFLALNATVFGTGTPPGPGFGRGGGEGQSTLIGGGGQNWFFTLFASAIIDLKSTDQVN
jgi:hypothetical protein